MGLARTLLTRFTRRAWVRVMARAGRFVGRWVDTSADAPEASYAPKRNLYEKLNADADGGGHDHDHDHGR